MKGTTKSKGRKDKLDCFYTKKEVAEKIVKKFDFSLYDLVIEPSAGDGAFSSLIPNCLAMDVSPKSDNIIKQDFFSYLLTSNFKKVLVIGNPPFGEQSKTAIAFFNHAAIFSQEIAFILPLSFKKESIQRKLNDFFFLKEEEILPLNSFTFNGEDYNVPCVFQWWEKRNEKRKKEEKKEKSNLFLFTSKEKADFRIQRVGGNAGKAFLNKDGAESSNYYLQNISSFSTEDLIRKLNKVEYPTINFTVGPKSLSKSELITETNKINLLP